MGINLADYFNIPEEELNKRMDDFVKAMVNQHHQKVITMYEKRDTLLPLLVKHLKEHGSIDSESMLYFPEQYSFSSEEFNAFFELATDYLEADHEHLEDEECMFENKSFFMKFEEIIIEFFIMWGQGTCTIMKWIDDEEVKEIPETFIGTFNGYKARIEKEYKVIMKEKNGEVADV